MYREFMNCENNLYLDDWIKNPPKELTTFKPDVNINEAYERSKLFLKNQQELIENLKKKGVII